MKNKELIKRLSEYHEDMEVCIFDWKMNLHRCDDEPISIGIQSEFKVEYQKESVNIPFISISYENDDYLDDGVKIL